MVEIDTLKKNLRDNSTFTFQSKFSWWIVFFLVILPGPFIMMGTIFTIVFSPMVVGPIVLFVGIILFCIIFYHFYKSLQQVLIISPYQIEWKGDYPPYVLFENIHKIEYYIETWSSGGVNLSSEHKVRFILKNGKSITKTIQKWKTPGNLPTDVYIKTILEYYHYLSNLKYSR